MQWICRPKAPGAPGLLALIVVLGATAGAHAQEDACASFAWPLKREQAALAASTLKIVDTGGRIRPGEAVVLRLKSMDDIAYALAPERKPKTANSFGAIVSFEAPKVAGLYQITTSDDSWIDVVQGDMRVKSSAFSGKQGCVDMRKSVRFPLAAAPVVVQISGAASDRVKIVVTPAE